jgi:hypothetical protein
MHAARLVKYDFNSGRAMPSGLTGGLSPNPELGVLRVRLGGEIHPSRDRLDRIA